VSTDGKHLAQANVARLRHPLDSPQSAEFAAALDAVYRLAERSPGFVWRGAAAEGHVSVDPEDPLLVVNVSVWRSYQALHEFTYRSRHGHFVRRRREWFDPVPSPSTVLWWVAAGETPAVTEALARLTVLRRYGPRPQAFGLRRRFDADGSPHRAWSDQRRR
jgi:heme-degrading monooxygenase HmoA